MMKNIKINDVVIIGGGTAGWLTAMSFLRRKNKKRVTLIESKNIPTIGVGESTQPAIPALMRLLLGYYARDWMPHANATYKFGVVFEGWTDHTFMVDSESSAFYLKVQDEFGKNYDMSDMCIARNLSRQEFSDWYPSWKMAKNNKSPIMGEERFDYLSHTSGGEEGEWLRPVQWDNVKIRDWFYSECMKLGITYIQDDVIGAKLDPIDDYVTSISTENNGEISGDLYIDCSGFNSVLLNKIYQISWNSVEDFLPNNKAIVIRKKYKNPQQECFPYTKSTAMDSGWMWSIPTFSDMSNGYVYSNKYIDDDDAEKELRTKIDEWDAPTLKVKWVSGARDTIAYKNVYGVGLSAGFVEPLESTSLSFTAIAILNLHRALHDTEDIYTEEMGFTLNEMYHTVVDEIISFIYLHYRASSKNDTLFWQDMHNKPMPDKIQKIYDGIVNRPLSQNELRKLLSYDRTNSSINTQFSSGHWWQLLRACGWYENVDITYSESFKKISKMLMDSYEHRLDRTIEIFPNHYDYLKEWYEGK
jgi:tryptophan halogenase